VKVLKARYYDGKTSTGQDVSVLLAGGRLRVVGRDVSEDYDARGVRRSLRIANTPRWLYLPGGGACVTEDNDAVDQLMRERRYDRLLHRWESRPAYAAVAVLLVVAAAWFLLERGVPAAVEQVARRIPVEAEASLARETLKGLDEFLMKPSALAPERQAQLRERFRALTRAAGGKTVYTVEFRASPVIGPNAFALPGGVIVMTDELVRLAKRDAEIMAVLAHEAGHVEHRHSMRRLLEGSVTALIVAGLTGDIGSATALATAAPTFLLQAKYSRDNEREADAFAIQMMRKAGMNPQHLAVILGRMDAKGRPGIPSFLSSHPATSEREALARAGTPSGVEPLEAVAADPTRPRTVATDPVQREVLALLDKGEHGALENLLGSLLLRFESDDSVSVELEKAFQAFRKLPPDGDAALNDWIERQPLSYAARTARGIFYLWRGIEARGSEYSRETPAESMRRMREDLGRARADLERSLSMSGKPYLSRLSMMTLARMLGDEAGGRAAYEEAVKLLPQGVEPRLARMRTLEPRWGGSLPQMEAFAASAAKELKDPAAVSRIAARVPGYRAFEAQHAGDFPRALAFYDEAVKLDAEPEVLCGRSWVLAQLKRHTDAYADAKRALDAQPDHRYCMSRAIAELPHLQDKDEAVRMATRIIEVNPGLADAYNQRAWLYRLQGKGELASRDLEASATLGNGWAQMELGTAYFSGRDVQKDLVKAELWLGKAAAQGQPNAKGLLDHVRRMQAQAAAKKG
jgi:Zn-dependent protease with chaperone function/TPR repeat protein